MITDIKNRLFPERITDTHQALSRAIELLRNPESKQAALKSFLQNKIDVTEYIVETIEKYQKKSYNFEVS